MTEIDMCFLYLIDVIFAGTSPCHSWNYCFSVVTQPSVAFILSTKLMCTLPSWHLVMYPPFINVNGGAQLCRLWSHIVFQVNDHLIAQTSDVTSLMGISPNLISGVGVVTNACTLSVTAVHVCWILILGEIISTESSLFKGDACFTQEYSHHLPRSIRVLQFPPSPVLWVGESCWDQALIFSLYCFK